MSELEPIDVPSHVTAYEARHHLPALVGTARQISWARLIRHTLLTEMQAMMVEAKDTSPEKARSVHVALEWLHGETDSNKWIDHREFRGDAKALVASVTAEMDDWAKMERQAMAEAAAILGTIAPVL
ncbi:MAG: hypothetical protein WCI73_08500 [Phycisphaerae bacterium]